MTAPLLGLGGLVFADSLNPFNIGAVWSITLNCRRTRRSPTPGALSYIAGLYVFTASYGLCMVLGLEAISHSVDFQITPGVRYPLELTLGALLIAAAWFLPNTRPVEKRRKPTPFPRQPRTLAVVGVGAAATQVPFSLPYLTLLGALSTADPVPAVWPVVILIYAAAVQVPPLLTLFLATRRAPWAHRLQRAAMAALSRHGRLAIRIALTVIGSVLLADAIIHHAQW